MNKYNEHIIQLFTDAVYQEAISSEKYDRCQYLHKQIDSCTEKQEH